MSESIVFIIGCIVFAITVYGTVMAGGTALTRRQIARDPAVQDEPMVAGRAQPPSA